MRRSLQTRTCDDEDVGRSRLAIATIRDRATLICQPDAAVAISDSFELDLEYAHPLGDVWRALTEPSQMALWLMNFSNDLGEVTADFRPVAGAAYRIEARKGRGWRGYVVGSVLEAVPNQRLAYTWAGSTDQDTKPVRVEFTLTPTAAGTHLRVVQSGFQPGVKGWFVQKGALMGWKKMLGSSIKPVLAGTVPKRA